MSKSMFDRVADTVYNAMPWEGETYQAAAETIATAVLNELGICPKDGEPMPCLTCGAGT